MLLHQQHQQQYRQQQHPAAAEARASPRQKRVTKVSPRDPEQNGSAADIGQSDLPEPAAMPAAAAAAGQACPVHKLDVASDLITFQNRHAHCCCCRRRPSCNSSYMPNAAINSELSTVAELQHQMQHILLLL